mmetsp:Transcript_86089/g.256868  ORF Transcript_86089/g.256868 Transcript_86089/m.256868 type:complete len:240 (-) Transcript_86089:219-938(-)
MLRPAPSLALAPDCLLAASRAGAHRRAWRGLHEQLPNGQRPRLGGRSFYGRRALCRGGGGGGGLRGPTVSSAAPVQPGLGLAQLVQRPPAANRNYGLEVEAGLGIAAAAPADVQVGLGPLRVAPVEASAARQAAHLRPVQPLVPVQVAGAEDVAQQAFALGGVGPFRSGAKGVTSGNVCASSAHPLRGLAPKARGRRGARPPCRLCLWLPLWLPGRRPFRQPGRRRGGAALQDAGDLTA